MIRTPHQGISNALNRGWRTARAAYVARLDADDIALPDRLARQAAFLDVNPSVAVVGGAAITIGPDGRRGVLMRYPTSSRAIHKTLLRQNCLAHPAVMIRRSALQEVGGYRIDHVEDYDLWLRFAERFDLANLADPVILYRQHPAQVSLSLLEEQVRRRLLVQASARARRAGKQDPLDDLSEAREAALETARQRSSTQDKAIEAEWLARAGSLAGVLDDEAARLVARASEQLGHRAQRSFNAARELKSADTLLANGRPFAGASRALVAFLHEPRYTARRLGSWLAEFSRSRLPARRS